MKFFLPFLSAAYFITPVVAWNFGLTPHRSSIPTARDIIQQQQALLDRMLPDRFFRQDGWPMEDSTALSTWRPSARYEVYDTNSTLVFELDVPGVNANDINISVKDDMLMISGHRELTKDKLSYRSRFSNIFSLDPTVETSKITAQIKNGVLQVTAPKDPLRTSETIKRIPILVASEESNTSAGEGNSLNVVKDEAAQNDGETIDLDAQLKAK
jgi:HSP20 family protein